MNEDTLVPGRHAWADEQTSVDDLYELLLFRPAFFADALCKEPAYAHVNFFPERGEPIEPARDVCARCLVRAECEAFAETTWATHMFGVWGGKSAKQRRQRRRPAA